MKKTAALAAAFITGLLHFSCNDSPGPLAPYQDSNRPLGTIVIQDSILTPKITWVGGYVTVFGLNYGTRAVLDSSLAWLVFSPGNRLKYPVTIGQQPEGSQDLTSNFGGQTIAWLTEDQVYTFWVMLEDAWNQVSSQPNKILRIDSAAASLVRIEADTVFLHPQSFAAVATTIDIFVNIRNVDPRGRLGVVSIIETQASNAPVVQFTITQTADTAVAAMGLVAGGAYTVNDVVWEVLSDDGQGNFRTLNVITSPLSMGDRLPGTTAFTAFPAGGLQRNQLYYFWIATKDWDGVSRTRTANYYAWATFETW